MTLESIKIDLDCIDDMTDDLLNIADVLEEYGVNVRLDNGRYLNPVSAIRSKVEHIWMAAESMAAEARKLMEVDA